MINTITEVDMERLEKTIVMALNNTWELNTKEGANYDLKRAYDEGFGVVRGFMDALGVVYTQDVKDTIFEDIVERVWRDYTDRYYEVLFQD